MSGDYSRKRFDSLKHYQGVLRQQGRVDLDADWNEYIDLQDRRWRAETTDIVGRCGVPSQTPDGFKIAFTAGRLTVGAGRMYVDGLLAENHGASLEFDAAIEERYGTTALDVLDQPYASTPVVVSAGKRSLVYLDVWRREVTYLQDPDLIEPALNVDTTARYQTVWQVKVLDGISADVDCQTLLTEIPNWPASNVVSAARLTTGTVAVTADADPCLVPPSGGYRGLENHLYRVEVHEMMGTGALRVKWSRENGSVATEVVEILPGGAGIRVGSVGRDDVLRFKTGDWVEVTSDGREFGGRPGEMRKVTVDDASQTLTFTPALPATEFPEGVVGAASHMRVVRWDQSGIVRRPDGTELVNLDLTTTGLIQLTAADPGFVLEDGIQVSFRIVAGGSARSGDHWCFAARTASADVQALDEAPPLGIHHHFCTLAIIEPDGTVVDCRNVFPPLTEITPGCCTVVVRPGENIQAALNSLPAEGGCVCLKVGLHEIRAPLRIERSNVTVHGESPGAMIVRATGISLLEAAHPAGLFIENIAVAGLQLLSDNTGAQEPGLPALVLIDRCKNATIEGCVIGARRLGNTVGIGVRKSASIRVSECRITGVSYGLWVIGDSSGIAALDNTFDAVAAETDGGVAGVFLMEGFGPSRIENNTISGYRFGIEINSGLLTGVPSSRAVGSVVAGNLIARVGVLQAAAVKVFAIDVAANACLITDNTVVYNSEAYGGIRVAGYYGAVARNRIQTLVRLAGVSPSAGILVGGVTDKEPLVSSGVRIVENSILGAQDGILAVNGISLEIAERSYQEQREGRFGVLAVNVHRSTVRGNRVGNFLFPVAVNLGLGNRLVENELVRGGRGVTALNQSSLDVTRTASKTCATGVSSACNGLRGTFWWKTGYFPAAINRRWRSESEYPNTWVSYIFNPARFSTRVWRRQAWR